jgi:hypothetical protein
MKEIIGLSTVSTACGLSIAQVFSRRLPTAAARVRTRVRSSGICGGQSDTGVGSLQVLRFPLPSRIPPGTVGQTVAAVPRGLSLTP